MRVLVLGGTGFIGSAAVRALAADGHEIVVYNRGQTVCELPDGVRRISGDRAGLSERSDELRAIQADVVLDTIAYTENNAQLVAEMFSGSVERAVVLSSIDVYRAYGRLRRREPGPPEPVPFDEAGSLRERLFPYRGDVPREPTDPDRWMDDYEKILVERAFRACPTLHTTVLRLPMVYGPADPQRRFSDLARHIAQGTHEMVLERGYANWRSSWGFVEDVGHAIALAVSNGRARDRIYNVCEAHGSTQRELLAGMGAAAGWTGELRVVPIEDAPAAARDMSLAMDFEHDLLADSSAIREDLGYSEPTPRADALARTLQAELERDTQAGSPRGR